MPRRGEDSLGIIYSQMGHLRCESRRTQFLFIQMGIAAEAACEHSFTLGYSHSSSPLAEGGGVQTSPSPQGSDGLKGCQGGNVDLFCSFQPLLFLQVFENRTFQGKGSVSQHGMKFDGGLFGCFGREITPSISFFGSEQAEMFSCSSY